MIDAAKALKGKFETLAPVITTSLSSTIIQVLNSTGIVLARNSVVGLGDPIFTPDDTSLDAFMREVTFRGLMPNVELHLRKYAITIDPAPLNRVVRAYISGVCQVKIDQQDESHEYAVIESGEASHLKSSRHGHARILWREGLQGSGYGYYDSGIQWAVVMLGVTGSSDAVGKSNGITARSGSVYGGGTVDLYRILDGAEDGPIETVEVLNPGAAISSGKRVSVAWDADDRAFVAPLECET